MSNTIWLNQQEFDLLCDEAAMVASESGADRELGFDSYDHDYEYICKCLGTEDWNTY